MVLVAPKQNLSEFRVLTQTAVLFAISWISLINQHSDSLTKDVTYLVLSVDT